jgi:hypothetical protein
MYTELVKWVAGAVYRPADVIVPMPGGIIAHFETFWPGTENCCCWEGPSVTPTGEI